MALRVLIADDEPVSLDRLRMALDGFGDIEIVGAAPNGDEALRMARETPADLMLLDIQMPGHTGLEIARELRGPGTPEVIFVTAFADFATEAFEVDAADYLLKPVKQDRLEEAIQRARRRRALGAGGRAVTTSATPRALVETGYETEFWIRKRDGFLRVPVEQILRIEAARDYALLHTETNSHILRITMSELERRLDPDQLLRVHRSAFVRPDTIGRVERNDGGVTRLHAKDGAVIDVGPSYAKRVAVALGVPLEPAKT